MVAGMTRLELATSCVTGRRSNRTELHPRTRKAAEETSMPAFVGHSTAKAAFVSRPRIASRKT